MTTNESGLGISQQPTFMRKAPKSLSLPYHVLTTHTVYVYIQLIKSYACMDTHVKQYPA